MTTISEEATSNFVDAGELRFHYNEAGSGHPVIFLHGSGPGATGWSNFRGNIGPFAEQFRAIAVDMPGWGRTEGTTMDNREGPDALMRFMDALGIERAALVGNSMGGGTSISFTADHPDRVSHLISMGAGLFGGDLFNPGMPTEGLKVLFECYADPSPANFKRLVQIMAFDDVFATDELSELRSQSALANPQHLKDFPTWIAGRLGAPSDEVLLLPRKLAAVDTPALVIHGRNDRVVNFEGSLRLVSTMPNSRLYLFNQCGHWAQLEKEDEFNRVVMDFIASN